MQTARCMGCFLHSIARHDAQSWHSPKRHSKFQSHKHILDALSVLHVDRVAGACRCRRARLSFGPQLAVVPNEDEGLSGGRQAGQNVGL